MKTGTWIIGVNENKRMTKSEWLYWKVGKWRNEWVERMNKSEQMKKTS